MVQRWEFFRWNVFFSERSESLISNIQTIFASVSRQEVEKSLPCGTPGRMIFS